MMDRTIKEFWRCFDQSAVLTEILNRSEELGVPNWYFGAGSIAQSIWNLKRGRPLEENIKDIDWVYFDDEHTDVDSEIAVATRVQEHFKNLPFQLDVKNQARVHLWYEQKFGYAINPYASIEEAIQTWPTTATAIAVTLRGGMRSVYAPFGLEDLLSLTVRPNKRQITEDIYSKKTARWKSCWPNLNIIEWASV